MEALRHEEEGRDGRRGEKEKEKEKEKKKEKADKEEADWETHKSVFPC